MTRHVLPGAASRPLLVTLALEGGGPLGAFTWGVLDRLVDVPHLRIEVVSGTSAGAMNAAMLVQGLAMGGPAGAKRLLETFWRRVSIASGSFPGPVGAWLHVMGSTMAPVVDAMRQTTAAWSPQGRPTGTNPLRGILSDLLDPKVFEHPDTPTLIVAATRVRTGEARLFQDGDVTVEALLASACLPQLFPAVTLDGEAYWDGGYASNPPLRALIKAGAPPDVIIVRTTPLERPEVPRTAVEIQNRSDEITFGAALRQELRSLDLVQQTLSGLPSLPDELVRLRDARVHMIGAEQEFRALKGGSKQDPTWHFLSGMRDLGQAAAERWIASNLHNVGRRSTLDLSQFAGPEIDRTHRMHSRPSWTPVEVALD